MVGSAFLYPVSVERIALWAKGLQARDLVRFVMYADGYGQFPLGRENFQKMSAEHQAIRCADCSSCTVKCPYGVRVAEMGMRAQELFA